MGRTCPLRASAAEAAPSSSSSTPDDFSWRLLEGANIHARREHARVALWPSTGDRARPPPPKRSFLDIDEVERFARDRGIKKSSLRLCYRELFRRGKSTFENAPDVSARDMKLLRDNFTVCTSEVVETNALDCEAMVRSSFAELRRALDERENELVREVPPRTQTPALKRPCGRCE